MENEEHKLLLFSERMRAEIVVLLSPTPCGSKRTCFYHAVCEKRRAKEEINRRNALARVECNEWPLLFLFWLVPLPKTLRQSNKDERKKKLTLFSLHVTSSCPPRMEKKRQLSASVPLACQSMARSSFSFASAANVLVPLLLAVSSSSSLFALALPGEGAGALAEGALAAVPTAKCGVAMLKDMYCRVLQDPDGDFWIF